MKGSRGGLNIMAALLTVATVVGGCDSSQRRSGGEGGRTGAVASQANDGGLQGSGGSSADAGSTGLNAGGTGSGSTGFGGTTGTAAGGVGGGKSSGLAGTGGTSTAAGGATTVDAGAADAGCVGTACPRDSGSNQDVAPACNQIGTQAACDLRSDCHSVNRDDPAVCGCAKAGCCTRFVRCESGGSVACEGQVSCTQATPFCEAPYTVQYQSGCYEGCVLASKCMPTATCPSAAPTQGGSCGSDALSCVYQDCAAAGRTQATCQGGAWNVQTVTCDSVSCKGGGSAISGVICGPGQICVHTNETGGAYRVTPSCATNNCGTSPIALSCVQGLSGSCTVAGDSTISCSMPMKCTGSTCPP